MHTRHMGIIDVADLNRSFGGQQAVDDLTMTVDRESITGMIGPNGSGKTTTFNLITGLLKPDSGRVEFQGTDITGWKPYRIANEGLGRTFQQARVFDEMTLEENLQTVETPSEDVDAAVDRWLSFVELDDHRHHYAGNLSGGQQVLLGIARTLMLDPDLILLDEPFAGVNPGLVDDIAALLERLRTKAGKTVLIVDHEIEEISALCDELIVLVDGHQLLKDEPSVVREDERVRESYLGL